MQSPAHVPPKKQWVTATLVLGGAVAVTIGGFLWMRHLVRPTILSAHTGFLLAQLDMSYSEHLKAGSAPVTSQQAFEELIRTWTIDWNSCEFRDGTMYDSWGTAIDIQINSSTLQLRSAGPDRRLHTSDDITEDVGNR